MTTDTVLWLHGKTYKEGDSISVFFGDEWHMGRFENFDGTYIIIDFGGNRSYYTKPQLLKMTT